MTDQTQMLECIMEFYETLFKKRKQETAAEIKRFLSISIFQKSLKINQNLVRRI